MKTTTMMRIALVAMCAAANVHAQDMKSGMSDGMKGGMKDGMKDGAKTGMSGAMVGAAEYTIIVKSHWTKANFPVDYPAKGLVTGPHHSGLIGTAHNASYTIVRDGVAPTPGLERLSEEGKHAPLDEEIRAAAGKGSAGMVFESGPLRDFTDSVVTTVKVDDQHPLIDFVMMIAPSPDWFTGVSNVDLRENGAWTKSRSVDMYAWDSGGDDGDTFLAADKDNAPKKATMKAMNRQFLQNGKPGVIATVTFIKK